MFKNILLGSLAIAVLPLLISCTDSDHSNSPDITIGQVVEQPNGGELYFIRGTRDIKWSPDFPADVVRIELFRSDSLYLIIANSTENTGKYEWYITGNIETSDNYRICVSDVKNNLQNDLSDKSFRITYPAVEIYDPPSEITDSEFRVQWYGNSDESELSYRYCVSTDTTITDTGVLSALDSTLWNTTNLNYSLISFPMVPFNSETVFVDSTSYIIGDITVQKRIVFSKFFIYCTDGFGAVSEVKSKVFGRSNNKPCFPRIFSSKLGVNGFSSSWQTVGPDSAVLVLSHQTENWMPIDFKWTGQDPDGSSVKLEYRWELWERERINLNDNMITLVTSSEGWSSEYTSRSFSQEIWDHNQNGQYAFKVFVRDDAMEESVEHSTVNFQVFVPSFDKGIMLLDDNDPALYPPPETNYMIMGNPDPVQALNEYEQFLNYSGYYPEGIASDSLSLYRVRKFEKGVEFVYWDYYWGDHDGDPETPDILLDSTAVYRAVYNPKLEELVKYRLIIIVSDDRSSTNGIDFTGEPPYIGYNNVLSQYLDIGGKIFILGPSVLMGKMYSSPDQLPVHQYKDPFTYVFDGTEDSGQGVSGSSEEFFRDYFGISAMTFPEQKTAYIENVPNPALQYADYKYADSYDFIGADPVDVGFVGLKIDSVRVNDAFFDRLRTVMTYRYALKDNGTVFTGVPTMETFKGETVYGYKSIYDLPVTDYNDSLAYELSGADTLFHKLYWEDVETGETGPVLHRTGTLASRYAEESGMYKTAFFGIPSFFMDNSADQVSDMFKAMVDWFDLSVDPSVNWKKK